jgi:zinc/manganese transport system substrate-binding protein
VKVETIASGHHDPHYVQARPSYARLVNRADLLVVNGLELEIGWLPPLLEAARNPDVRPGRSGFLDASTALRRVLEVPEGPVDRSEGDVHPLGNPHYWLDPRNGVLIARALAEALARVDPDGEAGYRARADAFAARLEQRMVEWSARAAPLRGEPVAAYHKEWEYLADWLGFRVVGYVEDRPGIPPTPRHLAELTHTIGAEGVTRILAAPYNDLAACRALGGKTGARLVVLPASVDPEQAAGSYESMFDRIVGLLLSETTP